MPKQAMVAAVQVRAVHRMGVICSSGGVRRGWRR
jgi:hypothetical protein